MLHAYNETTGIYLSVNVTSKSLEKMFKDNFTCFEDETKFFEYVAIKNGLDVDEVEGWEIMVTDKSAIVFQFVDIFEGNMKNLTEQEIFEELLNYEV